MPVMDGLEATQLIRQIDDKKVANIPIIAVTANAMKGDDLICLNAGMNDYIKKPINTNEILAKLSKWVSEN